MPTEAPSPVTTFPILDPPLFLSANRTRQGVLLQWSPPETPLSPLTGFVLQACRDQGQWVILSSNISANQSELLVQGLLRVKISYRLLQAIKATPHKIACFMIKHINGLFFIQDSTYDLRLMSRSNKVLSEPSESVSVSTAGTSLVFFCVYGC